MAERATCPYLVPVMVDHLWLYPVSVYCTSGAHTRVPSPTKLAAVCDDAAYLNCPGYLAARGVHAESCIAEALADPAP